VIPEYKIAVEIEGFAARGKPGRHQLTGGFIADMTKYNLLTAHGYKLLRYTRLMIIRGVALKQIQEVIDYGKVQNK